jgi:RNA polymerase sigma-70 factor (ECF subfamily)
VVRRKREPLTEGDLAKHMVSIRRYLAGMLRPDELEDATQIVLTRALENLSKFRGDSSPRVWILGIARNVGFEVARARQKEIARTWPRTAKVQDGDDLTTGDLLAADGPTQEETLGRKEQQALALAALDGMSLDDKLALLVTYVDGLPGPEAAELLGVSFAAFRQRLSRARQALAVRLDDLTRRGAPGSAEVMDQWKSLLDPTGAAESLDPEPENTG